MSKPRYSLHQMLETARREVFLRERIYPGLVQRGKMNQDHAAYELGVMTTIADLLQTLNMERDEVVNLLRGECLENFHRIADMLDFDPTKEANEQAAARRAAGGESPS